MQWFVIIVGHCTDVFTGHIICYVYLFSVTFDMVNSMTYYFNDAIMEEFVNGRADVYNPGSSFRGIHRIDDWYNVSVKHHIESL